MNEITFIVSSPNFDTLVYFCLFTLYYIYEKKKISFPFIGAKNRIFGRSIVKQRYSKKAVHKNEEAELAIS